MLAASEVEALDVKWGPFNVAACCDNRGRNSHLCVFWTEEEDCRRKDWAQMNAICNPPFSLAFEIIAHFLQCKLRQPLGTSAVFILPVWKTAKFWKYIIALMPGTFEEIQFWPKGTKLFTTPATSVERAAFGERIYCGPTRWDVVALRVGPTALTEQLPPEVACLPSKLVIEEDFGALSKKRSLGTATFY
jgi:hypothetical protein